MRQAALGRSGATVSALGLGCAGMSSSQEGQAHAAMAAALDAGITFFDTADLYGRGRSETLIGSFLAQAGRDRVILATKFGSMPGAGRRRRPWGSQRQQRSILYSAGLRRLVAAAGNRRDRSVLHAPA